MRCGFDTGPAVCMPMILAGLRARKNCESFFKKHNFDKQVQLLDIYRRLFSGLRLAVGRHHRRRIPRHSYGFQLGRVKVFLTDHVHTGCWIYHKLSFLRLFCWRSREYPFLRGKVLCSLVFSFELVHVSGKVPSLASGTSLLSFSLFMGLVLEFHSVGTSLMRNFDLYFSNRWSFNFPETCLT